MKSDEHKVDCSGCGSEFHSTNPDQYHQFCSSECRRIVEEESEDIIDNRHFVRLLHSAFWIQRLINQ
jgi:predicted nucleic acid-binding Zn ribbon protein